MLIEQKVWQEKYRPKHVKDVISVHTDKILKAIETPMSIQNFLFYSRCGGTGKTSMCQAIIKDLDCDYLALNASDERSIDTIRFKVKDFCLSRGNNPNSKKCVWMDEGEKLTKDAADSIKNIIETYSDNVFFLFTTNDIKKIPEPLQTRFNVMEFSQPDILQVENYVKNICLKENIKFDEKGINKIVKIHYPSLRMMVNHLQDLKLENKSVTEENVKEINDKFDELWQKILNKKYTEVRQEIMQNGVDVQLLNKHIFDLMLDDNIEFVKSAKIIQIIARNEKDFKLGADDKIVFIASLPEIIGVL